MFLPSRGRMPGGRVSRIVLYSELLGRTMVGKGVQSGAARSRVIGGGRQVGVQGPVACQIG